LGFFSFDQLLTHQLIILIVPQKNCLFLKKIRIMFTKRQEQVAGLIQEELSQLFINKFNGLVPKRLVTITVVRMSPDLSLAKVYLSIFPSTDGDKIIKELNNHVAKVRFELGNVIKNSVRHIPELVFYLDDSLDYLDRINKAINS
jgi:ribosome-binding factor A